MRLNKVFAILTLSILLNTYIEPYTLYHTVKRGENLYTIGKKYGKTPEEIKKLNNLKSSNLYPGQKLIVGVKEGKTASEKKGKYSIKEEKLSSEKSGNLIKEYYTVKNGDTLSKISKNFGVSVAQLKKMNGLKNSKLKIGQKLIVRIKKIYEFENARKEINFDEIEPIADVSKKVYYKVCEGDTIESICEKFQIEPEKLLSANLLKKEDLKVGQILVIPPRDLLEEKTEKETDLEKRSDLRTKIIEEALNFLGAKYRFGGESKSGLDCSALTRLVYRVIGLDLPNTSYSQFENGIPVKKEEALPGDLVFFKKGGRIGHVGIYLGNDLFVHASFTLKRVVISSLSEKYFKNRFAGFRRYLLDEDEIYFVKGTENVDKK
jgi:peptidoglycan endopeptidase LytE